MPSQAVRALGYLILLVGIVLLLYGLAMGWSKGYMGDCIKYNQTAQKCESYGWGATSYSVVLGWFLILIGPALAFGETPTAITEKVKK